MEVTVTDKELVMVDLASKATRLNRHYLYRLAAQNKIPHYRAGKAVRFCIPELLEWMKNQAQQKTSNGGFEP